MRLLLLGTATIALSGCSWLGGGYGHHQGYGYNQGYSSYNSGPVCCDGTNVSKWNLEGGIGKEYYRGGDLISGDLAAGAAGTAADQSFKSIYDSADRYELGFSKALTPNRKFTVMAHQAQADGKNITLGQNAGGDDITGDIDDMDRYGLELGLRQYGAAMNAPVFKAVRPYVEGRVGATHYDDIGLTGVEVNGVADADVALFEGGWVPTAAGLIGFEAPIFKQATLGFETGIRYTGAVDATDDLGARFGGDLEGANESDSNWTVPVMLRGRYRF